MFIAQQFLFFTHGMGIDLRYRTINIDFLIMGFSFRVFLAVASGRCRFLSALSKFQPSILY